MIYQINDSYLENVRTFLSKKAKFVGRFRKENGKSKWREKDSQYFN